MNHHVKRTVTYFLLIYYHLNMLKKPDDVKMRAAEARPKIFLITIDESIKKISYSWNNFQISF